MTTMSGMIYLSMPGYTVGLIVADVRVIDCPPIARTWALGRDAREVWREAAGRGARLVWLPDPPRESWESGRKPLDG